MPQKNPWFLNPTNAEEKIFTFADAPHLLKLIRNHFINTGLVFNNGSITSRTLEELLKYMSDSDVSITFKLTNEHLLIKGVGKKNFTLI